MKTEKEIKDKVSKLRDSYYQELTRFDSKTRAYLQAQIDILYWVLN